MNDAFAAANHGKFWYNLDPTKKYPPHVGTIGDSDSRLFSPEYAETWGLFATNKWYKEHMHDKGFPATAYLSLEFIHNNVHVSQPSIA